MTTSNPDKEFEKIAKRLRKEDPIVFNEIPETRIPDRQTIEQAGIDYNAGLTKSNAAFQALGDNIRRLRKFTTLLGFTCGMIVGTIIASLLFILLAP